MKMTIDHIGQKYIDEVVYAYPTRIHQAVTSAIGSKASQRIPLRVERVRLRWMKPDGKGGLIQSDVG